MDYRESLDYLYGLQRFGIKLGLENIRTLLNRLGQPERGFPIVHVAGSNGKGSVCAALTEMLGHAGRRIGLYTSPHLHSFTERIRIDRAEIAEAEVVALTEEVRAAATGLTVTFFEFTTALALLYFHRQQVEIAVLEVGMGGRLDATNAVTPQVSVITPVCLDHAEHLGPDLTAIAGEKAGIIKPGVPVVLGPQEPAALAVLLARAAAMGAPVYRFGCDFQAEPTADGFSFEGLGWSLPDLQPGLAGRHQHANLALALAAAALLSRQGVCLTEAALRDGVERVVWPGRLEWWGGERQILLDGAHNAGGARVLADYLATIGATEVRWVVGLKADKRPADIFEPLLPHCAALYCTVPPVETPYAPAALARATDGRPATVFPDPASALEAALADCRAGGVVLVAGSLFLVAAARAYLQQRPVRIPA